MTFALLQSAQGLLLIGMSGNLRHNEISLREYREVVLILKIAVDILLRMTLISSNLKRAVRSNNGLKF